MTAFVEIDFDYEYRLRLELVNDCHWPSKIWHLRLIKAIVY